MPKNKLDDLRNILFETMERLKDDDFDIERAKTIADIGQVVVNSAKVEVDFLKNVGGKATQFFPDLNTPETKDEPKLIN